MTKTYSFARSSYGIVRMEHLYNENGIKIDISDCIKNIEFHLYLDIPYYTSLVEAG